ncbi:response regulator transcription factor [Glutamicibacter sp. MNS18]|uniref:response regulator transcription factor n=1 Tax=Glutamicibacter sp. MNS18 TaxID=2989817 RepID=UPI0022362827|nr:response regulator transcription factor [Glutamicibacter sp. MNS18]MCW4464127.1 response regulator transcription factor [Glutamicibacter sp. MNS18]
MAHLLLLGPVDAQQSLPLPALELLSHELLVLPATSESLAKAENCELVVLDATGELVAARTMAQLVASVLGLPILLVVNEGGLTVLSPEWHLSDFVLPTASPSEVEARLRLMLSRSAENDGRAAPENVGGLHIDELSYTAKIDRRVLDLTYKEFELLKYLAQFPGRVFTREQLLHEVWGYDYYGGTRTVDVHVRRLRAKLGSDHEQLIGTVRNVGYRFHVDSD